MSSNSVEWSDVLGNYVTASQALAQYLDERQDGESLAKWIERVALDLWGPVEEEEETDFEAVARSLYHAVQERDKRALYLIEVVDDRYNREETPEQFVSRLVESGGEFDEADAEIMLKAAKKRFDFAVLQAGGKFKAGQSVYDRREGSAGVVVAYTGGGEYVLSLYPYTFSAREEDMMPLEEWQRQREESRGKALSWDELSEGE